MNIQDEIKEHLKAAIDQSKLTDDQRAMVARAQLNLVVAAELAFNDPEQAKIRFGLAVATLANIAVAAGINAETVAKEAMAKSVATLLKFAFSLVVL